MARPHSFSPKEAVRLRRAGKSLKEIAEISGLTVSGVQQILQEQGEVKQYASHKEALPWPNKKTEHSRSKVAERLRWLSKLAQGIPLHKNEQRNSWWTNEAINWANEILDSGMDIDYDRDSPPNDFSRVGGFYLKPADPEDWHIEKLMNRVRSRLTRKLG